MKRFKRHRWLRRLALGLAVAAVAAPAAQAIDPAVVNSDYNPGNVVTAPPSEDEGGSSYGGLPLIEVDSNGNLIARPSPFGAPASPTVPEYPAMDQLETFVFDRPLAVPVGQAYAAAYEAVRGLVPPSALPAGWAQPSTEAPATPVSVPGFDYRDAGVGVAIGLGAALLAAAGFLALRRNRRTAGLA